MSSPSQKKNVLIIGASRGLGAELAKQYAAQDDVERVYGSIRGENKPSDSTSSSISNSKISYIPSVDLLSPNCGDRLVRGLPSPASSHPLDIVIISAGVFSTDTLESPGWEAQQRMYTTSCVAPVTLASALLSAGYLGGSAGQPKLILIGSESGSITLRHEKEGGGNYGHHGSKAAVNMVGRLLALDLQAAGVSVATLHPGFMRTEMTRGVGFDKYWDDGGAVTPDVAAKSLREFIAGKHINPSSSGSYWAPRGAADIGTAEETLGKANLETPLKLPW